MNAQLVVTFKRERNDRNETCRRHGIKVDYVTRVEKRISIIP